MTQRPPDEETDRGAPWPAPSPDATWWRSGRPAAHADETGSEPVAQQPTVELDGVVRPNEPSDPVPVPSEPPTPSEPPEPPVPPEPPDAAPATATRTRRRPETNSEPDPATTTTAHTTNAHPTAEAATAGQAAAHSGEPSTEARQTPTADREPNGKASKAEAAEGKPNAEASKAEAAEGKPNAEASKATAAHQADAADDEPSAETGKATAVGRSTAAEGEPDTVATTAEQPASGTAGQATAGQAEPARAGKVGRRRVRPEAAGDPVIMSESPEPATAAGQAVDADPISTAQTALDQAATGDTDTAQDGSELDGADETTPRAGRSRVSPFSTPPRRARRTPEVPGGLADDGTPRVPGPAPRRDDLPSRAYATSRGGVAEEDAVYGDGWHDPGHEADATAAAWHEGAEPEPIPTNQAAEHATAEPATAAPATAEHAAAEHATRGRGIRRRVGAGDDVDDAGWSIFGGTTDVARPGAYSPPRPRRRGVAPPPGPGPVRTSRLPRRPWAALPGLVLLALATSFFAWVAAEPFWLSTGHGQTGTVTVVRDEGAGLAHRCQGRFVADGNAFEAAKVSITGLPDVRCATGTTVPARMVSAHGRQAWAAGDAGLNLRWGLGFSLVGVCALLIVWVSGATKFKGRRRLAAIAVSLAAPLLLSAGIVAATF